MPTLSPTPTRQPSANLARFTPQGWENALAVSEKEGLCRNADSPLDGEAYVCWAITNAGPSSIEGPFFIDMYLDGVVVQRWVGGDMRSRDFIFIDDWDRLQSRARLEPGEHTLKIVMDSTDLIPETDESDNVLERVFTWNQETEAASTSTPIPFRLPDLAPFTPDGWDDPITATSYSGDTFAGPLSVGATTYVSYAVENRGLSSTPGDIWVHLYLDDVLVDSKVLDGLIADGTVIQPGWAGLFEVANVSPGAHILRVVVDPTDLVMESDEDNNIFEKEFTWSASAVPPRPVSTPTPQPTPPWPLVFPNLVPGWRFGWDGPIIVSHEEGTFLDGPLTVDRKPFVDIVVQNQSRVEASPFSVDLYFDGEKAHTFEFSGGARAAAVTWKEDWDSLSDRLQATQGRHTLRIVIDPDNAVAEENEGDNVYEKRFVWGVGEVAGPEPVTYSDGDIRLMLADLRALLDTQKPALSPGPDYTDAVLGVAEAGYYLMTGTSLEDERVNISLLSRKDYLAWIDDDFEEEFAVSDESEYVSLLARRERIKTGALGLKTRRFGKVTIVVDAERRVAAVIDSLAHELGHMRQDFLNPEQTEARQSIHLNAIQEAGAQQFQRAFWLALEEFTGLSLLAYPDYVGFHTMIDNRLDSWIQEANWEEHSLGHLLQWLIVLDDPDLVDLRDELVTGRELSLASALEFYSYLVNLPPGSMQPYVNERLEALPTSLSTISALSRGRLVDGLHPDDEGVKDLHVVGLVMP